MLLRVVCRVMYCFGRWLYLLVSFVGIVNVILMVFLVSGCMFLIVRVWKCVWVCFCVMGIELGGGGVVWIGENSDISVF